MTDPKELSMHEVFKIRDSLTVLEQYGVSQENLSNQVNQAISNLRDGDTE